jgi:PhnB protein
MTMKTVVHLNFRGDAREALAFYRSIFGGDQTLVTYADAHVVENPAEANQLLWGQIVGENGFHVMAHDVPSARPWRPGETAFFVSIVGDDADEITRHWTGLCEGGAVIQPLEPSRFSPVYGMVKDRFGVTWTLHVQGG